MFNHITCREGGRIGLPHTGAKVFTVLHRKEHTGRPRPHDSAAVKGANFLAPLTATCLHIDEKFACRCHFNLCQAHPACLKCHCGPPDSKSQPRFPRFCRLDFEQAPEVAPLAGLHSSPHALGQRRFSGHQPGNVLRYAFRPHFRSPCAQPHAVSVVLRHHLQAHDLYDMLSYAALEAFTKTQNQSPVTVQ